MKRILCLTLMLAMFAPVALAADAANPYPEEKLGLKLGLQCYTARKFTLVETIQLAKRLDLKYIECYSKQKVVANKPWTSSPGMPAEALKLIRETCKENGVSIIAYGVVGTSNKSELTKAFATAKRLGAKTVVVEGDPKVMGHIQSLCTKNKMRAAVHNHPKPSRYWDPNFAAKQLKKNVGLCADIGHWTRSGVDPISGLMIAQPHDLYEIHFGDLDKHFTDKDCRSGKDVIWGTGKMDIANVVRTLHDKGVYTNIIMEYEAGWKESDLKTSIDNFRKVCIAERASVPKVVTPGPLKDAPAPEGATVLFNGKEETYRANWVKDSNGKKAHWKIIKGALVMQRGGYIKTKQTFGDCQLHLEFATPKPAKGTGQARGNSGVFFGDYEVQVLDNYKNYTYPQGQCASIYKQSRPKVNACRPPGEWQSYDITYTAPVFDKDGKCTTPATLTVVHNGILVQDKVALKGPTEFRGNTSYKAHGPLPLRLQDHGNPVRYRNIWIVKK